MDMEHETPTKLVVLATHGDGEPPKTLMLVMWKKLNTALIILINPHST